MKNQIKLTSKIFTKLINNKFFNNQHNKIIII